MVKDFYRKHLFLKVINEEYIIAQDNSLFKSRIVTQVFFSVIKNVLYLQQEIFLYKNIETF